MEVINVTRAELRDFECGAMDKITFKYDGEFYLVSPVKLVYDEDHSVTKYIAHLEADQNTYTYCLCDDKCQPTIQDADDSVIVPKVGDTVKVTEIGYIDDELCLRYPTRVVVLKVVDDETWSAYCRDIENADEQSFRSIMSLGYCNCNGNIVLYYGMFCMTDSYHVLDAGWEYRDAYPCIKSAFLVPAEASSKYHIKICCAEDGLVRIDKYNPATLSNGT